MVLKPLHLEVLRMLENAYIKNWLGHPPLSKFYNHRMVLSSTRLAKLETWNSPHIPHSPSPYASSHSHLPPKNPPGLPASSEYSS